MNLAIRQHRLAPLVTVTVAALVFAILLIAVRLQWAPLESADHGAASGINHLIAGNATLVSVVKAVTFLGSNGVLWTVIAAATVILAIRRRWRLAAYLLVTGAGALILDPILKSLVGRLRPVVAHPIAHGTGDSFPSGHSLGSIVCYGAILLVFLPAARGRWRTAFITVIITLIALIGISRILLGVHYLSDVLGAWAVGITWLGVTAFAFELTRRAAGLPVTDPVTEGLEPEARADLKPARPESGAGRRSGGHSVHHWGRIAAGVVVAWVLILGIIVGIGELITKDGNGNVLGDRTIPHWFAAHRTASWTHWSLIFTTLGATQAILIVALATCVVFLAVTRHWRPVIFVATVMFGELGAFLAAAAVVKRPRPDVTQLDKHLPTSAYPSGHEAATCCLYVAVAILVIGHARGWWRWLFLIPAIAMPVLVALSRMYRGEHHPTDILASLLFSALWLTATALLIKPHDAEISSHDEQTARAEAVTTVRSARLFLPLHQRAGWARTPARPGRIRVRPAGSPDPSGGRARRTRAGRAGLAWRLRVVRCEADKGGEQMTPRRTRGDAVDRTAQGIDRMLRNVETGRFERSLSALTAAGALVTAAEIYFEHDSASFGNKMMWLPVALGPVGAAAGLAGFFSRRMAKTALPIASAAIVVNGVQGLCLHARGIAQKPGGWRNARYNMEMGPPLLAPLLVTMVGGMGLLAAILRREK